jgi:hypothetical protein
MTQVVSFGCEGRVVDPDVIRDRVGPVKRLSALATDWLGDYHTGMRFLLALFLLPNLLVTPALCVAHAGEHESGCAPHFHTHQLPFGFPVDDEDEDHDADAVPAPQLTAPPGEPSVALDTVGDGVPLVGAPMESAPEMTELVCADSPPPRTPPLYIIGLTLRL